MAVWPDIYNSCFCFGKNIYIEMTKVKCQKCGKIFDSSDSIKHERGFCLKKNRDFEDMKKEIETTFK